MAITKEKKVETLKRLKDVIDQSTTLVFVGFKGVTGTDTADMRGALREHGVGFIVAKKTLMQRALSDAGFEGELPTLEGEVAIAYSADEMMPAQDIRAFEKKFVDQISILGGVFAGVYKTKEEMTEIASIPGLPTLRGMFVNVINAPIQGFAVALNQIAEKRA